MPLPLSLFTSSLVFKGPEISFAPAEAELLRSVLLCKKAYFKAYEMLTEIIGMDFRKGAEVFVLIFSLQFRFTRFSVEKLQTAPLNKYMMP